MSIYRDGEPATREVERVLHAKRRLLGVVWPASSCPSSWDTMTGDERRRRCLRCTKRVYDVAPMSPCEVSDLADQVAERDGSEAEAEVRFYRRRDGRFMVGDCPDGLARERRRRRKSRLGIAAVALAVVGLVYVGSGGSSSSTDEREHVHAPTRPILGRNVYE